MIDVIHKHYIPKNDEMIKNRPTKKNILKDDEMIKKKKSLRIKLCSRVKGLTKIKVEVYIYQVEENFFW